jgi:hypothetical protein
MDINLIRDMIQNTRMYVSDEELRKRLYLPLALSVGGTDFSSLRKSIFHLDPAFRIAYIAVELDRSPSSKTKSQEYVMDQTYYICDGEFPRTEILQGHNLAVEAVVSFKSYADRNRV